MKNCNKKSEKHSHEMEIGFNILHGLKISREENIMEIYLSLYGFLMK